MKKNLEFSIRRFSFEIGWFHGEEFSFIDLEILTIMKERVYLLHVKIAKFCISIICD